MSPSMSYFIKPFFWPLQINLYVLVHHPDPGVKLPLDTSPGVSVELLEPLHFTFRHYLLQAWKQTWANSLVAYVHWNWTDIQFRCTGISIWWIDIPVTPPPPLLLDYKVLAKGVTSVFNLVDCKQSSLLVVGKKNSHDAGTRTCMHM